MGKTFFQDMKVGERGEWVVLNYLYSLPYTEYVLDTRYLRGYQEHDIDFIMYTKKKKVIPIEVKSDRKAHLTGNIAYEVISSTNVGSRGCFEKTKAKFVFYYLIGTHELFYINVKRIREYIDKNYKNKKRLVPMGDSAEGYLVSINELIANRVAKKISLNF